MGSGAQHNLAWNAFIEDGYRAHMSGCYREAELIYKTALRMAKQTRLVLHSSTAQVLCLLGDLYAEDQHYAAGERMYRLALLIYEQIDGVEPIDTAIVLKQISEMCRFQDKVTEARDLNKRAEAIVSPVRARLDYLFKSVGAES